VFCLCRKQLLPGLTAFLAAGGRKMTPGMPRSMVTEVAFDDEAAAFSNINTETELKNFRPKPVPSALCQRSPQIQATPATLTDCRRLGLSSARFLGSAMKYPWANRP